MECSRSGAIGLRFPQDQMTFGGHTLRSGRPCEAPWYSKQNSGLRHFGWQDGRETVLHQPGDGAETGNRPSNSPTGRRIRGDRGIPSWLAPGWPLSRRHRWRTGSRASSLSPVSNPSCGFHAPFCRAFDDSGAVWPI